MDIRELRAPREILARLRADGVRARGGPDTIYLTGPQGVIECWKPHLAPYKRDLILELGGRPCVRCEATGVPLVPTFWTGWEEGICRPCVPAQVAEFDRDGWPGAPWEDHDGEGPRVRHPAGEQPGDSENPH